MNASPPSTDDALEARQLEKLRGLITAIAERNPFYADRLRAAGLDRGVASVAEFIDRMPFTTKIDLARDQETHPPYGTNLTFPLEHYARVSQTSSSTGRPLRWLDTPESWSWMSDGWAEVLAAAGTTRADRVLVAFSFGPFIGLWLAFDAAARMGCLTIPGGAMDSAMRLRVMIANRVTVLCCTPTYAIRLGDVAREEGLDPAEFAVRAIIVGGEPGASIAATRRRIEGSWPGARVFDHYGMTEVGPVTYQCDECVDAVHVLEESYLCEVVDPATGQARPTGTDEPGELVLTPLGRTGSPLLRYRTGDLVRPWPRSACACGRTTLRLAGGIIGRADDMVVVRGVNLFPSAVEEIIRGVEGVAEYRVEIDTEPALTEVRLVVEPAPACADPGELRAALERAFRAAYNLRIPVEIVSPGKLPRFELKSRRWIRHPTTP